MTKAQETEVEGAQDEQVYPDFRDGASGCYHKSACSSVYLKVSEADASNDQQYDQPGELITPSNGEILKKVYTDIVRRGLAAARGYQYLDLVPKDRDEGERGPSWVCRRDEYADNAASTRGAGNSDES
jgi:predicted dithiol-disulfide oxidoreductase (DUF899 family)